MDSWRSMHIVRRTLRPFSCADELAVAHFKNDISFVCNGFVVRGDEDGAIVIAQAADQPRASRTLRGRSIGKP